ncbi:MAG: response regulator transcription factor [Peptococcaceae bacterium]|nr:response regulator transcription factor [Peptococcaceae bacterium]
MRIAICDDRAENVRSLREQIKEVCARLDVAVSEIAVFTDGMELLKEYMAHQAFDIIFLDIDMPRISGMEAAREIRLVNDNVLIVFVTSYQEYMRDAFKVEAFDYLVKPVHIRELHDVLKRCMAKYTQRYGQIVIKTVEKEMIALSTNEILFIQSHLHHIIITMNDGTEYAALMKLDQMEEILRDYSQFVRCHQSYIANLEYTDAIQSDCFTIKKAYRHIAEQVPISRNRMQKVKAQYLTYRMG